MTVEVCSEITPVVNSRNSFSHNLKELNFIQIEIHNQLQLNRSIEFNFWIPQNLHLSSTDKHVSYDKILSVDNEKPTQLTNSKINNASMNKLLIEFLVTAAEDEEEYVEKPNAKSL